MSEEDTMVTVSTRAKEALAQMRLSVNMNDQDVGLRLEAGAGGDFGLVPDTQKPGDSVVVEYAGAKILLIDDRLADTLQNTKIDCLATSEGAQLVIRRADDPDSDPDYSDGDLQEEDGRLPR
jgi:Fe-S cluster assembly iron-binding protein IscA